MRWWTSWQAIAQARHTAPPDVQGNRVNEQKVQRQSAGAPKNRQDTVLAFASRAAPGYDQPSEPPICIQVGIMAVLFRVFATWCGTFGYSPDCPGPTFETYSQRATANATKANKTATDPSTFEKQKMNSLELPPNAKNPAAAEVLRVWAVPDEGQQFVLKTTWQEPGAWGLLLADIARHAAKANRDDGLNEAEALVRIKQFLDAEFARPTDQPTRI
jgi:hypothetical protein